MKAPKKIYIHSDNDVVGVVLSQKIEGDVGYTRTDSFIEKSFEFFCEHLCEYIDVKNANCDTFVNIDGDKLKEDFRNYIKGE